MKTSKKINQAQVKEVNLRLVKNDLEALFKERERELELEKIESEKILSLYREEEDWSNWEETPSEAPEELKFENLTLLYGGKNELQ